MAPHTSTKDATELLAKLVAFDTTSAKSNLELIAFVQGYLDGQGVASTLVPDGDGKKACLFASIGEGDGGVGLSGNHRPAAYYAADYCAYPVATTEMEQPRAMINIGLS